MTYMKRQGARSVGALSIYCNSSASGVCVNLIKIAVLTVSLASIPVGAQTWSQRTSTTADDLFDVAFSTASTAASVGANSVTIASGDGGTAWSDETVTFAGGDTPDLNAVFSSAATIVGVGQDQMGGDPEAVITSNDYGATWVEVLIANLPPTDANLNDGLFVTSTNVVAVGDAMGGVGEIILSVDRGASWTNPLSGLAGFNAVDSRGALVVAVGDNIPTEMLAYSQDSGLTWLAGTGPGAGQNMNDVAAATTSSAVAVGQAGVILRTTDSGVNWANIASPTADNLNAIDGTTSFLVAVGANRAVVRSIDSGVNWILPTTPPPVGVSALNDVQFLASSIVLAVGDNGEIYSSSDRGDVWVTQTSTTTEDLLAIAYSGFNNTLVVGTTGMVLQSLDQIPTSAPIPFQSKWPLVLLLVGAGLVALRRLRMA